MSQFKKDKLSLPYKENLGTNIECLIKIESLFEFC